MCTRIRIGGGGGGGGGRVTGDCCESLDRMSPRPVARIGSPRATFGDIITTPSTPLAVSRSPGTRTMRSRAVRSNCSAGQQKTRALANGALAIRIPALHYYQCYVVQVKNGVRNKMKRQNYDINIFVAPAHGCQPKRTRRRTGDRRQFHSGGTPVRGR